MDQTDASAEAGSRLCAWLRVDPKDRVEYAEFHSREHLPERLGLPGFRSGRRFRSIREPHHFFIVYNVAALAVLTSPEYVERLNNPTPWTASWFSRIRSSQRAGLQLWFQAGPALGGMIAPLYISDSSAAAHSALQAIAEMPGIMAVSAGSIDETASNLETVERNALGSLEKSDGSILMIEGIDEEALLAVAQSAHYRALRPRAEPLSVFRLEVSLDNNGPIRRSKWESSRDTAAQRHSSRS